MLPKAQTSFISRETDAARMILGVSLAVLTAAACLALLSELPPRPLQPEWILAMGSRLRGLGPSALLACLGIRLTPLLRPRNHAVRRWARRCQVLAGLIAIGWLLLIPLQLISAEIILQRQNANETSVITAARRTADEIGAAQDLSSFRAALGQVVQPQTIPLTFEQPLSQLKANTLAGLDRSIRRSLQELNSTQADRRRAFWRTAVGNTVPAASLGLGFAAIARSRKP